MRIKSYLWFVMLSVLVSGCVTEKVRNRICLTCPTTPCPVDSAYNDLLVLYKDSTSTVPDSAGIRALFQCDSLGNVYIKELATTNGKLIRLQGQLQNNTYNVKALLTTEDSAKITRRYMYAHNVGQKPVFTQPAPKCPDTKPIPYTPTAWQNFSHWFTLISLILIGLGLILYITIKAVKK